MIKAMSDLCIIFDANSSPKREQRFTVMHKNSYLDSMEISHN